MNAENDNHAIDLFEHYETLPENVKSIIDKYSEMCGDGYKNCYDMHNEMKNVGYTFDWYLDAIPFNLKKL